MMRRNMCMPSLSPISLPLSLLSLRVSQLQLACLQLPAVKMYPTATLAMVFLSTAN